MWLPGFLQFLTGVELWVGPNALMGIPFTILSVLGIIVFFAIGDWPVAVLSAD